MNENIYSLLNEIDNQADTQILETADPSEIKKWKKAFHSRQMKNKKTQTSRHWGRYTAAAAAVLILGISAGPARQIVYAQAKAIVYNLSDMLGIKKDLSPYNTVVGQSIAKNGITLTLNDVILDHETLLVSYSTTAPEILSTPELESDYMGSCLVYINGKQVSTGASGGAWKADDYTMVSYNKIELPDIDTSKSMDIELYFSALQDNTTLGSFAFSASGETLMAETVSVDLNKTYVLPDQTEITFTAYTSNSLGQNIYYETSKDSCDFIPSLKGTDDLGNEVSFSLRYYGEGRGRLETDQLNGYIDENAAVLTLTPYVTEIPKESGRENDECVAIAAMAAPEDPSAPSESSGTDENTNQANASSTANDAENISGTADNSESVSGTPLIINLK